MNRWTKYSFWIFLPLVITPSIVKLKFSRKNETETGAMSKPTPPPLAVEAIPPKTQASEPESMSREEIAASRQEVDRLRQTLTAQVLDPQAAVPESPAVRQFRDEHARVAAEAENANRLLQRLGKAKQHLEPREQEDAAKQQDATQAAASRLRRLKPKTPKKPRPQSRLGSVLPETKSSFQPVEPGPQCLHAVVCWKLN